MDKRAPNALLLLLLSSSSSSLLLLAVVAVIVVVVVVVVLVAAVSAGFNEALSNPDYLASRGGMIMTLTKRGGKTSCTFMDFMDCLHRMC